MRAFIVFNVIRFDTSYSLNEYVDVFSLRLQFRSLLPITIQFKLSLKTKNWSRKYNSHNCIAFGIRSNEIDFNLYFTLLLRFHFSFGYIFAVQVRLR